jgi:predicted enzyme related to lactoylglutathione lyase
MMPRPIHFEIPADNPQRAVDFYSKVFGWTIKKWDGPMEYWMITTGKAPEPGIDGGIMPRHHPNQACVNTIGVENLDKMVETVLANGGSMTVPKMAVPTVGWLAYCKDTEGHVFGMMQNDPNAK